VQRQRLAADSPAPISLMEKSRLCMHATLARARPAVDGSRAHAGHAILHGGA
jgi:hypothetical protein